jgi:hypothetical protein
MKKTIKDYFDIKELVDENTFRRHGKNAWQFICPMLQETLLILRENIGKPIIVNDWANKGGMEQRGLRHNRSNMVKDKYTIYLSAHMMGKAVDFHVKGMTATEVREWIVANQELFPYKIRLERKMNGKEITWVHLDVFQNEKNPKIYLFDV